LTESQRTLVLLKPDAVQRVLVGPLIGRLESIGLRIAGMKLMQMDDALARRHYAALTDKPFFERLVSFISSAPLVAMVLEGPRAVAVVRKAMGETDPSDSPTGSIRGDFALTIGMNLIHGSDSPETAAREIDLFFQPNELLAYTRDIDRWILE
jgi:nucleoside-diphosphate kinase